MIFVEERIIVEQHINVKNQTLVECHIIRFLMVICIQWPNQSTIILISFSAITLYLLVFNINYGEIGA